MKTGKRAAALVLALCLLLAGCGSKSGTSGPTKVVLIAKSTQTEFWKSVFAGAKAAASEYNVELTIAGPETEEDFAAQNDYIDLAVAGGAEALVFSAISYDENAPAIDRAAAAGVKVVVIDSDVHSNAVAARIGTDNVDAGRKAAEAALQVREGELVVGLINYDLGSRNGQEREAGVREVFSGESRVKGIYGINVLAEQEDARLKTLDLLQRHPEINALIAFNEPTSVGAALAVDELELNGRVSLVGFDSNVRTVDLMQTGAVSALVVQNPYAMGYLGVETACSLLGGVIYDPNALIDTSTRVVQRENMFDLESQKAMFSFH